MDFVETNGETPRIEGLRCEELFALEFWYAGSLEESAHQVFLKFAGRWHRLYFDYGTVFWRPSEGGPVGYCAEELESEFRVRDIGSSHSVKGTVLEEIQTAAILRASTVEFRFQSGRRVVIACIDDRSDIAC